MNWYPKLSDQQKNRNSETLFPPRYHLSVSIPRSYLRIFPMPDRDRNDELVSETLRLAAEQE
jgi:hypothetical protein